MKIEYLFSSPEGDISAGRNELKMPFKLSPWEDHPFLTLGDYFDALRDFVLMDKGRVLALILERLLDTGHSIDSITKILIRSDKHGALYHLSSIEVFDESRHVKFSVSTAVSERGRGILSREYLLLKSLGEKNDSTYLPQPFLFKEMENRSGPQTEKFSFLAAEWFDNYHEWHISRDRKQEERILIWDLENGYRFASDEEGFEILKKAAMILSLYYDIPTLRQIYPWHHAAGDFIVRPGNGEISVKLTTARNYEPIKCFSSEKVPDPVTGLVYFFINLSIRIRLDKIDGEGESVLAGDFSVEAAAKGFFEALCIKRKNGMYNIGGPDELLSILRSFNPDELKRLYKPLMDVYEEEDPEDFRVIESGLESHIGLLMKTLHEIRL
jgi:hypothetical protein